MSTTVLTHPARQRQHGVAALTVVMLLFLVLAMVTAYTSRNLVFEQRTGVNQVRSTQAIEVAQAGLDWALAMLNSGRITTACGASANLADDSFRDRYLTIDADTGALTPRVIAGPPVASLTPSCVLVNGAWTCSCPSNGAPSVTLPTATGVSPAFRVRFLAEAGPVLSAVQVQVNGCTRLDEACLAFPARGTESEGRATITALVAMKSALTTPPVAALTSRGNASGNFRLVNTDAGAGGLTLMSGATPVSVDLSRLQTTPGTPPSRSLIENDPGLQSSGLPGSPFALGQRMFASVFGMWPKTYREQPGALMMTCGVSPCLGSALRGLINANPNRPVIVNGDLTIDDSTDIGSPSNPVVIVVEGSGGITFNVNARIFGLVYGGRADVAPVAAWPIAGPGRIQGALVSEHQINAAGTGDTTVVYDSAVLSRLRVTHGSYAMVPGSWKDYE